MYNLKTITATLMASFILTGCVFSETPINVAHIEKEIEIKYDKYLDTKWVVTNKYELQSELLNNNDRNTYFIQYRGILDRKNKIDGIKLYLSDLIYKGHGDIEEIVGEDSRYFTYKIFKKDCSITNKRDKELLSNKDIDERAKTIDLGKNIDIDKNCIPKDFQELKDVIGHFTEYENTKTLVDIPVKQLRLMSINDYALNLKYKNKTYQIIIPKQLSEGMYRTYFKYK